MDERLSPPKPRLAVPMPGELIEVLEKAGNGTQAEEIIDMINGSQIVIEDVVPVPLGLLRQAASRELPR